MNIYNASIVYYKLEVSNFRKEIIDMMTRKELARSIIRKTSTWQLYQQDHSTERTKDFSVGDIEFLNNSLNALFYAHKTEEANIIAICLYVIDCLHQENTHYTHSDPKILSEFDASMNTLSYLTLCEMLNLFPDEEK